MEMTQHLDEWYHGSHSIWQTTWRDCAKHVVTTLCVILFLKSTMIVPGRGKKMARASPSRSPPRVTLQCWRGCEAGMLHNPQGSHARLLTMVEMHRTVAFKCRIDYEEM